MDQQTCTRCQTARPLAEFAKDARLKSGVRAVCKPCDRAATRERRHPGGPKPGALVLVGKFPEPPPTPLEVQLGPTPTMSPPVGDYAAAAERLVAALDPPAGPADALLIRALRGLAELADSRCYGIDAVKDTTALVGKMIAVQRELAATRAAKGKPAAAPAPAVRSAASY